MNLVEELQSLDANDVGRWPLPFRVAVIVIVFVLVTALGVYFTIVKDKAPQLERAKQEEVDLRQTFENKQKKAANYDAYKAQLAQIEQSFGTMLRQLPGETEIPSLIVDISQTGLAAEQMVRLLEGDGYRCQGIGGNLGRSRHGRLGLLQQGEHLVGARGHPIGPTANDSDDPAHAN